MSFSSVTVNSSYRLRIPSLLFPLLSMLLLLGCGEKGVLVKGTLAKETSALTTMDGNDTDLYSHAFIPDPNKPNTTQVSFTIGLNKVVLQSSTDLSLNFVVFDTGVDNPFTVTIPYTANNSPLFGTSPNNPITGVYDQIQYEVTFFELALPTGNHKVRLYLADTQSACQNDIQ